MHVLTCAAVNTNALSGNRKGVLVTCAISKQRLTFVMRVTARFPSLLGRQTRSGLANIFVWRHGLAARVRIPRSVHSFGYLNSRHVPHGTNPRLQDHLDTRRDGSTNTRCAEFCRGRDDYTHTCAVPIDLRGDGDWLRQRCVCICSTALLRQQALLYCV